MTLFDHPIWPYIAPYAHPALRGVTVYVDFLQLPEALRNLALGVEVNCVACGKVLHPLRARVASDRSRIAGTPTEKRLFYAPTCETEKNSGCSRTKASTQHRDVLRAMFGLSKRAREEGDEKEGVT